VCNNKCNNCSGPAEDKCTSCYGDEFYNDVTGYCFNCDLTCLTCVGSASTQCSSCFSGNYLSSQNECN
jgi:hypothetical protein